MQQCCDASVAESLHDLAVGHVAWCEMFHNTRLHGSPNSFPQSNVDSFGQIPQNSKNMKQKFSDTQKKIEARCPARLFSLVLRLTVSILYISETLGEMDWAPSLPRRATPRYAEGGVGRKRMNLHLRASEQ